MSIPQILLTVRLDNEVFGIDGDTIEQILRVPSISPIPLSASVLKGVVVLAGKIVSVIDLKKRLGLGDVDITNERARLLSIEPSE